MSIKIIIRYFKYFLKYLIGLVLNPYLKTQYGSYQVFVNPLATAEANKIPKTPQIFPNNIEKMIFKIAVPNCINLP